jgi:hypothetical protein
MKYLPVALTAAGFALLPATLSGAVLIGPSAGFTLAWNGNDGDNFNAANPAPVPANLATAAGATPFTSSDLGPQIGVGFHIVANINDGLYGNSNSWIGGDVVGTANAGVSLSGLHTLTGFAFGRDNGNAVTDPGAGGQLIDRSLGLYTIQFTQVGNPAAATETGDAATGWQTLGTLDYAGSDDNVVGGQFTSYYRHEYSIGLSGGGGVTASGLRLIVPATGLATGTAIDEIELFGSPVPEPGSAFCLATALGFFLRRRRQSVA